ncbi:MAG: holo-ACP synthase [Gammaproteobacteria bacterium]|nr:holo-ACP synthase [Gammaproteobacteria bacterium]
MAVLGVGTDIVSVSRIEQSWQRFGPKFAAQILHPNEVVELAGKNNAAAYLAKRFAAKEAVGKALGTGLGEGVSASNIEVKNKENGAPTVQLHGGAQKRLEALGGSQCQLSISDEKEYAVAFAIIS